MAVRACVSNQKGGTGKTTVAINLAGALADRGHRVLLIDLDPQGYATEGSGEPEAYDEASLTLHDVLLESDQQHRLGELIHTTDEYDLVPSSKAMSAQNTESMLRQATGGERRLGMALDNADADYDFVIVDCPPGLGALTDNALYACERVVVPAGAKGTSMRALELLVEQIETLNEFFDVQVRPIALVANEVRPDGVSDQMLTWFDDVFQDSVPVIEVRKRVALQRALMEGKSIFAHEEECDMEAAFHDLADVLEAEAGR